MKLSLVRKIFENNSENKIFRLDEAANLITDYVANGSFASLKKNVTYFKEENYAILLRLKDHSNNFKGDFVYVDEHAYNFLSKSKLEEGDIIVSNVGARLGTTFKVPNLGMPLTLGPNSILIRSDKYHEYLFSWLSSEYGQKKIKSIVSGAGQPKFNKTMFRKLTVPIPENEKSRRRIIKNVREVNIQVAKMLLNCQNKINYLEELKKSILEKAFKGELTSAA